MIPVHEINSKIFANELTGSTSMCMQQEPLHVGYCFFDLVFGVFWLWSKPSVWRFQADWSSNAPEAWGLG